MRTFITLMLAPFHTSYVARGLAPDRFLSRGLGVTADRAAAVAAAGRRAIPPTLLAELTAQQRVLPPSAARDANLAALHEPGTAIVATGQQMGLFLGPLYTLHKAATAIVLARRLAAETGARVVPLFWLQTEDHDFAEIATALSPKRDGTLLRSQLHEASGETRCSVAQRGLGGEIVKVLDELLAELDGRPHTAEVEALLRASYREGARLPAAFAQVLATIFADDGLVLLDPRNVACATLAAPLVRRALADWQPIEAQLVAQTAALAAAGFSAPIELRPGSPLPFCHHETPTGPRQRLQQPIDPATLALVEQEPLRFSSSALLRPLVQDALLPIAAYVGGPAEVGYLAQLQPLYETFGVTPSLVAPRAQLLLVPPAVRRALAALQLPASEVGSAQPEAIADPDAPSARWLAELDARLAAIGARDPELQRALQPAIDRTHTTIHTAIEKFAGRYLRAVTERGDSNRARLARARAWLAPDGAPQERTLCFAAFAAEVGLPRLRQRLLDAIDPYAPALREVDL